MISRKWVVGSGQDVGLPEVVVLGRHPTSNGDSVGLGRITVQNQRDAIRRATNFNAHKLTASDLVISHRTPHPRHLAVPPSYIFSLFLFTSPPSSPRLSGSSFATVDFPFALPRWPSPSNARHLRLSSMRQFVVLVHA